MVNPGRKAYGALCVLIAVKTLSIIYHFADVILKGRVHSGVFEGRRLHNSDMFINNLADSDIHVINYRPAYTSGRESNREQEPSLR